MKFSRYLMLFLVCVALLAFGLGSGCTQHAAVPAVVIPTFDKDRAWADLLKQVGFGPRVPGTDAHQQCQDWLVTSLKACTDDVTLQPFKHVLGVVDPATGIKLTGTNVAMNNVLATIKGTGEGIKEGVVLMAHWDCRPTADYDANLALRSQPISGANDAASGVAILLEVARQLKEHPISRDVTIVLIDGEDYGTWPNMNLNIQYMLLGSQYYADHLPADKPAWGVLLDMVGDADLNIYREPYSEAHAKAVNDRLFSAATEMGYLRNNGLSGFVNAPNAFTIEDDHYALNDAGIPTVDLIDFDYGPNNSYWHTSQDTSDKCSADSLKIVGNTVLYALQLP
jgi:glutaminyl-peptide cyclotransferase